MPASSSHGSCFPTGVLGYWARRLADGGLVGRADGDVAAHGSATRTAARRSQGRTRWRSPSPARTDDPVVADVSMGKVTHGDVLAGRARPRTSSPSAASRRTRRFALAVGLQLLVDALAGDGYGAVLLVARPEADPVPAFRERAAGVRLPGDR